MISNTSFKTATNGYMDHELRPSDHTPNKQITVLTTLAYWVVIKLPLWLVASALLMFVVSGCGNDKMPQGHTHTLRIRVEERVTPPFEEWSSYDVYKCHDLDSKETGNTINIVVPKVAATSSGMFVPRKYTGFKLGSDYNVLVSERLPLGWTGIEKEFTDDRIGLLALLEVRK